MSRRRFRAGPAKDVGAASFSPTSSSLEDQFGVNDGTFEVRKPVLFCNPADKNGEGIENSEDHLACYKIRGPKLEPAQRPRFEVVNQLGTVQLEAKKPFLLCVRSSKTIVP